MKEVNHSNVKKRQTMGCHKRNST